MGIRRLLRSLEASRAAQRTREVNARCRLEEVRTMLRYGSAAERSVYLDATASWRAAGQPDVPFVTHWYAAQRQTS